MTSLTLNIPDGATGREVLVETACRLFDAQRLTKTEASRMCGLTRSEFDDALVTRGLPVIRYTEEMWGEDLRALERMRKEDALKETSDKNRVIFEPVRIPSLKLLLAGIKPCDRPPLVDWDKIVGKEVW